jgi:hypothetical protein
VPVIRRRLRASCLLSVWLSVWGAAQGAKGEADSELPPPSEPPSSDEPPATEAQSNVECRYERYVVLVALEGFDPALATEVRKDLAAELAPRGIGVCTAHAPDGELAAELWLSVPEPALVSIQVDDRVTGKRVARDVPATGIPPGGKALAIAIAADELLRASWAELDLPRRAEGGARAAAPSAPDQPPPRVNLDAERRIVNARAAPGAQRELPRPARRFTLGLLLGYTRSPRAWNALGAELRAQGRPFGWGWAEGGLGGFGLLEVDGAAGSARARGFGASASLGACSPEARLVLCGGARANLHWIQFRGLHPKAGRSREEALPALVLSAVGQLGLRLSKHWLGLFELSLGGAALAANASDGAGTLAGLDGFVFSTGLGLGFQP